MTNHLKEAIPWLDFARNLTSDNTANLTYMEEFRQKAGVSYEDLGTSEEEVARLRVEGYKAEARKWLGFARNLTRDNTANLTYMEDYRHKAEASYEDLNTSEGEVARLRVEGYKAEAREWLGYARNPTSDNRANLTYMEEYRQLAGASYGDLGTSEEEIARLRSKAA